MTLTRQERERIIDNRMRIQSVADSLTHIDPAKIQDFQAIRECLKSAERNLTGALQSDESPK